jgi:hypothetical protein
MSVAVPCFPYGVPRANGSSNSNSNSNNHAATHGLNLATATRPWSTLTNNDDQGDKLGRCKKRFHLLAIAISYSGHRHTLSQPNVLMRRFMISSSSGCGITLHSRDCNHKGCLITQTRDKRAPPMAGKVRSSHQFGTSGLDTLDISRIRA